MRLDIYVLTAQRAWNVTGKQQLVNPKTQTVRATAAAARTQTHPVILKVHSTLIRTCRLATSSV